MKSLEARLNALLETFLIGSLSDLKVVIEGYFCINGLIFYHFSMQDWIAVIKE